VSLILDALRRADSERERERGAVPGLHAQQVAVAPEVRPHAGVPPWLWIVIVAALALLVALAAWFMARGGMPRPIAAPAVAQPPGASAPAVPPAAATTSPPANAAAATPPATVAAASPSPPASAAEAQPVAEPAPWPSSDGSRKAPTAEVASAAAARAPEAKAVPPAGAAPVEAPVTPREGLPENIRAQLPPLAVGGSIYSSNAPDRSVIIDGRILRENDRLGADLTLEQIRPKSAVLRFKGYRFEIGF
jgi:general secretion pathway protein B